MLFPPITRQKRCGENPTRRYHRSVIESSLLSSSYNERVYNKLAATVARCNIKRDIILEIIASYSAVQPSIVGIVTRVNLQGTLAELPVL